MPACVSLSHPWLALAPCMEGRGGQRERCGGWAGGCQEDKRKRFMVLFRRQNVKERQVGGKSAAGPGKREFCREPGNRQVSARRLGSEPGCQDQSRCSWLGDLGQEPFLSVLSQRF